MEMSKFKGVSKIHFVGVKGVGMSALAVIVKKMGFTVTGSDVAETFITDHVLASEGVPVKVFAKGNVEEVEAVVHSVAYGDDHVELAAAKDKGLPIYTFPQTLAELMSGHTGISITGCNGKTTTTGMIATILYLGKKDPTYVVPAPIPDLEISSRYGEGDLFVVEADEYRRAFLNYAPHTKYAVITNIEWDHPDCYPSFKAIVEAYQKFIDLLAHGAEILVYGEDDGVKQALEGISRQDLKIYSYGFEAGNDYLIRDVKHLPDKSRFEVVYDGASLGEYELIIPGDHNILNATAALAVCLRCGISKRSAANALKKFKGAKRRFEVLGTRNGVSVVDDYAHHPTAINVTLQAAQQFYPNKKIWAVFQPHTFSRTQALLKEFSQSFGNADEVIIMDIYASAREKDTGEVHAQDLVSEIKKRHPRVRYFATAEQVLEILRSETRPSHAVITLGAGDLWNTVAKQFVDHE